MAEPRNSDTVTDRTETEHDESAPDAGTASAAKSPASTPVTKAPVKKAPMRRSAAKTAPRQKSYHERRKEREAAAAHDGAGDPAGGAGRIDLQKSSAAPGARGGVSRTAVDRTVALRFVSVAVAAVVLIAVVAGAVLFGIGKHSYDRKNDLRAEYAAFAQQVTVNLTTLNPENVGQLEKTLTQDTSGYAKQQMEQAVKQTAELVKQGQLSTKTTVLSTAVTRADPDRGSAIMVFGWTSKSKDPKEDMAVETYRWRVDMTRINGQLKMTNFEWVW